MSVNNFKKKQLVLGMVLAGCSTGVFAGGFAIVEQSVTGLGGAFSGVSAAAEDISMIYFNPATLAKFKGRQVAVAAHYIMPNAEFQSSGLSTRPGGPLMGNDGGNGGVDAVVPNFYYGMDLAEGLRFGLGITAPFGLATDYKNGWEGRYHALESELMTVNINPIISWKADEKFSFGFGLSAQYMEVKLTNAVDTGLALGAAGSTRFDSEAEVKGDDWGWGWNFGVLYEPVPGTRLGLAYRSSIKHDLDGKAKFKPLSAGAAGILSAIQQGTGTLVDTDAKAAIDLPETVSLGLYHDMSDRLALTGDVTWTRWERFKELRVDFASAQPDSVKVENWENTIRVSLGVIYKYSPALTLRTGVAYDEEPIPNAAHRTPRIPGNDRKWIAFGGSYKANEQLTIDVGYAHLFVNDSKINDADTTGHTLVGEYEADVDILSAQARWDF